MATSRRQLSLLILAAVLGALLLLPAGALAATCDAGDMIDAAANNRQIAPHTMACYQQAIAALPGDVDSYDPAVKTNLIAAMQRDSDATATRTGTARALQSALPDAPAAAVGVRGPVTSLLEGLGPAHADEVPVPVLALGGAAGLLLLAGLGTSLARLRQRRLAR
ncbi:MAG TPA: hypothetical protein VGK92_06210 [Gaiellales bacterium]|jgi:hypothetical protein